MYCRNQIESLDFFNLIYFMNSSIFKRHAFTFIFSVAFTDQICSLFSNSITFSNSTVFFLHGFKVLQIAFLTIKLLLFLVENGWTKPDNCGGKFDNHKTGRMRQNPGTGSKIEWLHWTNVSCHLLNPTGLRRNGFVQKFKF